MPRKIDPAKLAEIKARKAKRNPGFEGGVCQKCRKGMVSASGKPAHSELYWRCSRWPKCTNAAPLHGYVPAYRTRESIPTPPPDPDLPELSEEDRILLAMKGWRSK